MNNPWNTQQDLANLPNKSWLKEPMAQFILIGVLTFTGNALLSTADDQKSKSIRISESELARIESLYTKQWGVQPSAQQLQDLLKRHIREEVLYREALSQRLEEDDIIIRRRLIQKMEFLLANAVEAPSDEALQAYYQSNKDEFKTPAKLSFDQVFFSRVQRGQNTLADAQAALKTLQTGNESKHYNLGDKLEMPSTVDNFAVDRLERDLGEPFSTAVMHLQTQVWAGPIESPLGLHLVRLRQITPENTLPFEQVREAVSIKVTQQSMKSLTETNTQKVIDKYEIQMASSLLGPSSKIGVQP